MLSPPLCQSSPGIQTHMHQCSLLPKHADLLKGQTREPWPPQRLPQSHNSSLAETTQSAWGQLRPRAQEILCQTMSQSQNKRHPKPFLSTDNHQGVMQGRQSWEEVPSCFQMDLLFLIQLGRENILFQDKVSMCSSYWPQLKPVLPQPPGCWDHRCD